MHCAHCGKSGPQGVFCTFCGAHQASAGSDAGDPRGRSAHYAVSPGEAVSHPSVFSTLFPHLGHHKVHDFRLAFFAGVAVLFLLVIAGLVSAAIVAAALLVPVLYLVYLYEAQVYRDEPAAVIGITMGGGIVLGLVVTIAANSIFGSGSMARPHAISGMVVDLGALLTLGLLVPVVQEIAKVLPALVLRARPAFSETADGLVFGVAAGLGFGLAETLVNFSGLLSGASLQSDSSTWIYTLVSLAVLTPLLQGSATGAISASLWKRR
jgi:RsiW-degrading membrane proteinase PrsW (M82 family)